MDKLHDWCGRSSVKKTMLKHQEIFKEQVCELHRLYRVQKSLMAELRNKDCIIQHYGDSSTVGKGSIQYQCIRTEPKTEYQNSSSSSNASNYQYSNLYPIRETSTRDTGQGHFFEVREFGSQDVTCCSRDASRSWRSFDLEQTPEEYAGDDVSTAVEEIGAFQKPLSSKVCMNNLQGLFNSSDEDTNVELTLSIGGNNVQKKRERRERGSPEFSRFGSRSTDSKWPMPSNLRWPETLEQPAEKQRFPATDSTRKDCNAPFDRENLHQASWMLQALPLHRTL